MLERQSWAQETRMIVWFPQQKLSQNNGSLDWRLGSGKLGQRCKKIDAINRKHQTKIK